jgi:hypothetical protein
MLYEHFLVTRFNLRAGNWKTTRTGINVLTDSWLKNRFRIFEEYCLPCVAGQTNQNFRWLLFFDSGTPPSYKDRIMELKARHGFIEPRFIDSMDQFQPGILKRINESPAEYIITSRLDNDDSISMDYVDQVQQQFDSQDFEAIDIVDGYVLSLQGDKALFGQKRQLNNPFISLIERNTERLRSVWFQSHASWKKIARVRRIYNRPLWFSIIHGENLVNRFDATRPADLPKVLERFTLPSAVKEGILSKAAPPGAWTGLRLKNRLRSIEGYYLTLFKMKLRHMLATW